MDLVLPFQGGLDPVEDVREPSSRVPQVGMLDHLGERFAIADPQRSAIGRSLEERFTFLMRQLKIDGTAEAVARFVRAPQVPIDREAEIVAAGGKITAAEKKAEGLAD